MEGVRESAVQVLDQFLCFVLGGETYGIPILKVREIQVSAKITRIPQAPEAIPGVINLRGQIIPVLDLLVRFGFGVQQESGRPVIIIVEIQELALGLRVESVSEVVDLDPKLIQAPADWGGSPAVDQGFIRGMANRVDSEGGESMLILLDLEHLLTPSELGALPVAEPGSELPC